jgi:hypothetical protein
MNELKDILFIVALGFLIFLAILLVRVIAVIVAYKRHSDALLNRIFEGKRNLPIHLAFLLIQGKSYIAEWKTYRIIKRGVAREKAEHKRMLKLKAKNGDEELVKRPAEPGKGVRLNHKQIIVFWVAIVVIVLMLIFPPWRFHMHLSGVDRYDMGSYCLIFDGPVVPSNLWRAEIDWARLLLPIFVVVLVASGLLFTLREKRPPAQ